MSELPDSWMTLPIGEVNQFSSTTINPSTRPDELFELYSVPSFPTRKPERFLGSAIGSTKQTVTPGDVLVSKINPRINRVWTVGPKAAEVQIASSEWIGFRSSVVQPIFANYYFKSPDFRELLCSEVAGVGGSLTRAQPKRVTGYPVPIAPSNEQTRIANQLDTLLTRVQACNDRFDAIPALLKRFRQTVLDAATTGGLTDDWRQSESTPGTQAPDAQRLSSNQLPFGWKQYQLRELVDCFDNARIPIKASERAKRQGAFSYYGAFGIIDSIDDFLFDGEYLLLAEDGKNLENRDRPIALIANGKFWVNNHAHVIRPNSALDIRFLLHWLNSKSCDISDLLTGIDQIKLTRGAMDRIPVPLPPANEQAEIVRRVEALFAIADRIEARCTTARAQAQRLSPLVLAKAFRGELVPQDPSDEPASALLARIASSNTAVAGENKQKVPVARKKRAQTAINL